MVELHAPLHADCVVQPPGILPWQLHGPTPEIWQYEPGQSWSVMQQASPQVWHVYGGVLVLSFWQYEDGEIGSEDRRVMPEARYSEALVRQWAEWQALFMVPITPHWSEVLWEILGKTGCAVNAGWPKPTVAVDAQMTAAGEYLFDVAHSLAAALVNRDKKKKPAKGKEAEEPAAKPNQVNLYVADVALLLHARLRRT